MEHDDPPEQCPALSIHPLRESLERVMATSDIVLQNYSSVNPLAPSRIVHAMQDITDDALVSVMASNQHVFLQNHLDALGSSLSPIVTLKICQCIREIINTLATLLVKIPPPEGSITANIRKMERHDIPQAHAIEQQSFEFPWPKEEFVRCMQGLKYDGFVAEHEMRVLGYFFYAREEAVHEHDKVFHLLNLAVAPKARQRGIASQMLNRLIDKLSTLRRNRITLEVREKNFDARLFFLRFRRHHPDPAHRKGFRTTNHERGFFREIPKEEACFMEYRSAPLESIVLDHQRQKMDGGQYFLFPPTFP